MAIVSQLCISFPYVLHGLCEDYLTCDIAFNAVMPLSRASTRGRYSRIEGVTLELEASLRSKLEAEQAAREQVAHDREARASGPEWSQRSKRVGVP